MKRWSPSPVLKRVCDQSAWKFFGGFFYATLLTTHAFGLSFQGASGQWSTTTVNWYDGSTNTVGVWVNGSDAYFGAPSYQVAATGVTVDDISMNGGGSGLGVTGTITFGLGEGTHDLNLDGSGVRFFAAISGTEGFTKLGANGLYLEGNNSGLSGPVVVSAGLLEIDAGNGLPSAAVTVAAGASLQVWQSYQGYVFIPAHASVGSLAGAGDVLLMYASSLSAGQDNSSTIFSGAISGGGTFVKQGTGTLTLQGNNTNAGSMTIQSGTLEAAGGSALADGRLVTVQSGAVLRLLNAETVGGLVGAGSVELGASKLTLGSRLGLSGTSLSGIISGSGDVQVDGGQVFLGGANTFTGAMIIRENRVEVSALTDAGVAGPLGAGNRVELGSPDLAALTAKLYLNGLGGSQSTNRALQLGSSGGTIGVVAPTGTLTWSGVISGGAAPGLSSLTKTDAGTLRLTAANTYTGTTTISAGKLEVTGGSALPDAGRVSIASGATLELVTGADETIGSLEGAGNVQLGGQKLTIGADNTASVFSGVISGTAASRIEKVGAEVLTLSNASNSFTGGVAISEGTISVPSVSSGSGPSYLGAGGTITLGDASYTGGLVVSGSGSYTTDRPFVLSAGGGGLAVSNAAAEVALTGSVTGSGILVKSGPGRLRLEGSKTYDGETLVMAGTLRIAGPLPSSTVRVYASGTVESTAASNWAVGGLKLEGGTVAPGGTGTAGGLVLGDITLEGGALSIDLNGVVTSQYDQLLISGQVAFDGPVTLSLQLGYDPQDFVDEYQLIANSGAGFTTLNGANAGFVYNGVLLEEGQQFWVTSNSITQLFEIHYGLTSADNDVRLVAVPEPAAASLLALAGLVLGVRRRRLTDAARR